MTTCNEFWPQALSRPARVIPAATTTAGPISGPGALLQPAAPQEAQPLDMVATEPAETPTQQAEAAAEAQGTDDEPEQTEQECRGWIAVRSRYMNFDLIAVSFTATVYKLDVSHSQP